MPLYMEDMVRPHKMDTILPSMTCEQKGELMYVFITIEQPKLIRNIRV